MVTIVLFLCFELAVGQGLVCRPDPFGLEKPIHQRYVDWMWTVGHGEFGVRPDPRHYGCDPFR